MKILGRVLEANRSNGKISLLVRFSAILLFLYGGAANAAQLNLDWTCEERYSPDRVYCAFNGSSIPAVLAANGLSVAYYTWDFGDGHIRTTTNPNVAHYYSWNPAIRTLTLYIQPQFVGPIVMQCTIDVRTQIGPNYGYTWGSCEGPF